MKTLILLLALCALACEPQVTFELPSVEPPDLGCLLPPEFCEMDDEEFDDVFSAMSEAEQAALIAGQVEPRGGFVSRSK